MRVEGFQWEGGNARKSVDKHGVGQTEAVFFNALGRTDDDRLLLMVVTLRDEGRLIRVISARDMRRRGMGFHEQAP